MAGYDRTPGTAPDHGKRSCSSGSEQRHRVPRLPGHSAGRHERPGALHALRQQLACLPVPGSPERAHLRAGGPQGGTEAIEARAQELVGKAWRQAQQGEQKTMRLPSAPSHLLHTLDKEPQLRRSTAKTFAGLYAVCLRFASGTLSPLSLACEQPAEALRT